MPGAIVIGAGPGIGTSVARRLAREGLPVAVLARSQTTVDAALASLEGIDTQTVGQTRSGSSPLRGTSARGRSTSSVRPPPSPTWRPA